MRATKKKSIKKKAAPRHTFAWLGIPDHQGVANVGGRVGAAKGPTAFRQWLKRFADKWPAGTSLIDAGDVERLSADVSKNHTLAAERVERLHQLATRSIIVGGGHDHGYSQLLGLKKVLAGKKVLGCINVDAHLDLRKPNPWITSGSPFYLAIEHKVIAPRHLIEFGIQPQCNSVELWDYAKKQQIPVVPFHELRFGKAVAAFRLALKRLTSQVDAIVISMDLDAVRASDCPGVSAPQSEGFDPSDWFAMVEEAARHPKVISLGIFELNPDHDRDDLSVRLAATTAYRFVHASS